MDFEHVQSHLREHRPLELRLTRRGQKGEHLVVGGAARHLVGEATRRLREWRATVHLERAEAAAAQSAAGRRSALLLRRWHVVARVERTAQLLSVRVAVKTRVAVMARWRAGGRDVVDTRAIRELALAHLTRRSLYALQACAQQAEETLTVWAEFDTRARLHLCAALVRSVQARRAMLRVFTSQSPDSYMMAFVP